jgi:hypothetical protein
VEVRVMVEFSGRLLGSASRGGQNDVAGAENSLAICVLPSWQ